MNIRKYYPLFLVALATASIIFQVVGFTSTGWLIIRNIGYVSAENSGATLNKSSAFVSKNHTQANEHTTNERLGGKNEPVDNRGVPITESDDGLVGNIRHGRPNVPIYNGSVPIPVYDDTHIGNIRPGRTNVRIDNGSIPIPVYDYGRIGNIRHERPSVPIDNGGVPIPISEDGHVGNVRSGGPNVPIDNGGVQIPVTGKPNVPNDNGGVPIPVTGKPNMPIVNGGVPIPVTGKPNMPIDNGGVPIPVTGKPNMPIDNGGVPIPVTGKPNMPIDNGGVPIPVTGKPNMPIDNGGVPIPVTGKPNMPIVNGGVPIPVTGKPNMPIDNGGVPIPVTGKPNMPIDNGGVPITVTGKPNMPIDNGGVPIPASDDGKIRPGRPHLPIDNGGVPIPVTGKQNMPIDNGGVPIPVTGKPNVPNDKGDVTLPDSQDEISNEDQNNTTDPIRPQHKFPSMLIPTPDLSINPNGNHLSTDINGSVPPKRPRSSLLRPKLPSITHPSRNPNRNLSLTNINGDFPPKRPATSSVPPSLSNNMLPTSKPGQKAATRRSHLFPNAPVTSHLTPITNTSMQNFRHQTSTMPIVESIKNSASTPIQSKSVSDSKDVVKGSVDRQTQSKYDNLEIGLWVSRVCEDKTQSDSHDCSWNSVGFSQLIHGLVRKDIASDIGGMATWNDLRVETMLGLIAGIIGLAGSVLTVKPLCLNDRRRLTTTIGISGMALSCVLFLVPVARVMSIYWTLKESFRYAEDATEINTPYAAVISGIGACFALITAGLLALSTWADEKQKWSQFEDEPPIVFTKHTREEDNGCKTSTDNSYIVEGAYDNNSFKIDEN